MNIQIDIECDTISELIGHLAVLKRQILRQAQINKVDTTKADFPIGTQLYDDNCYGTHELNVIEVTK